MAFHDVRFPERSRSGRGRACLLHHLIAPPAGGYEECQQTRF